MKPTIFVIHRCVYQCSGKALLWGRRIVQERDSKDILSVGPGHRDLPSLLKGVVEWLDPGIKLISETVLDLFQDVIYGGFEAGKPESSVSPIPVGDSVQVR